MDGQLNLPLIEPDLFGMTTCDNHERCLHGPLPLAEVFAVTKHVGKEEHVFHFCCEACANDFYLDRLREGM